MWKATSRILYYTNASGWLVNYYIKFIAGRFSAVSQGAIGDSLPGMLSSAVGGGVIVMRFVVWAWGCRAAWSVSTRRRFSKVYGLATPLDRGRQWVTVVWILGCHSRRIYYFSGLLFRSVGNICKTGCNFVWASRPESPTCLSCGNCPDYMVGTSLCDRVLCWNTLQSLDSGSTVIDFEDFLVSNSFWIWEVSCICCFVLVVEE